MSIPVMLSMLIQALYNIVDSMFIAYYSSDGLTAVSLCYPVQMIIIAIACGTGVGVNSLLSRFLGEKEKNKANLVAMHGLFLALCNGIVFAVVGYGCAKQFLSYFSDNQSIINMGVSYMRICTLFSFGVFFYFFFIFFFFYNLFSFVNFLYFIFLFYFFIYYLIIFY